MGRLIPNENIALSSSAAWQQNDDESLMLRVQRYDDIDAFEQLVHRYEERARRIFLSYFGTGSDIEDHIQTLFLHLFQARSRYRAQSRFQAWFYRIAMNVAHDAWRKQKRRTRHQNRFRTYLTGTRSVQTAGNIPENHVLSEESAHRVETMVHTLPRRQRQIVILRFVEEMSLAEIAETLGVKVGSIKAGLHHALRKLKTMALQEGGYEPR